EKQKWEESILCYEKLLELKPWQKEQIEQCLSLGELLVNQNKLNIEEHYLKLGNALQKQGKLFEAVEFYHKIIELNKSYQQKLSIFIANKEEICKINIASNDRIIFSQIYPEKTFLLHSPKTVHSTIEPKLLGRESREENSSVVVIPNASMWISDARAIAIASSEDEILIKDVFHGPDLNSLPVKKLPPALELDEPTVFLSVRWGHNYSHWMLGLLPKIGLLQESGINLKSIGKFVVSSQSERPFQRETLEILGIPSDRIVESMKYPYIKAKTLIVPKLFAKLGQFGIISRWGYEFIKKEFIKPGIKKDLETFNGIYISRQDAPTRRVINESEVVNFLSKFGIRSVTLTSMSIREQALLFASAKVVVGSHGAGLSNLLFCHQGTKVIELIPQNDIRICYYVLSNRCELDYYYLLGKSVTPQQDFKVNLDLLSELMKLAGLS
ncbi:MAG: DUF563 domain-containing protein, partial [Okeania sp. SIO3C4]|nr:DUF563 domain-containing protein [Okeania sp. SIO3C4]